MKYLVLVILIVVAYKYQDKIKAFVQGIKPSNTPPAPKPSVSSPAANTTVKNTVMDIQEKIQDAKSKAVKDVVKAPMYVLPYKQVYPNNTGLSILIPSAV
jgi:hypothetical protein